MTFILRLRIRALERALLIIRKRWTLAFFTCDFEGLDLHQRRLAATRRQIELLKGKLAERTQSR